MMEFGCQVKASRLPLQDWNISEIISHLCQGCTLWSGMAAMRIQCSLFPLKKRTPYSAMGSNWQFPVVPLFSICISSSCGPTTFWSRAQQSSSAKSRFFYTTSSSGRISLEGCLFAYWSDLCLAPSSFLWNLFPYTFVLLTSLCNHPLLRCKAFIIWVYAVDIWARRQSWRGVVALMAVLMLAGTTMMGGFSAVEGISTVKIWSHLPFWQYSKRCCVWELSIEM